MVVTEAKYRTNCLDEFYNKNEDFCKKQMDNDNETDPTDGTLYMF